MHILYMLARLVSVFPHAIDAVFHSCLFFIVSFFISPVLREGSASSISVSLALKN